MINYSTNKTKQSNISIAVTSVGGGVGQSLIKALYETDYRLIGLDASHLGVGLYTVPRAYLIPHAKEDSYLRKLKKICQKERCQLLFPGSDIELSLLAKHAPDFKKIGTTVVVSKPEVIKIADDKLLTTEFLETHNLLAPKTAKLSDFIKNKKIPYPIIIKPQAGGSRSQNVFLIKNNDDLKRLLNNQKLKKSNFVAQEYIKGDEYTCGTVNWNNECHGVIVMKRILRNGDTYKCFVVKNKIIEKIVKKATEALKPFGACNIQLRIKNNQPYIFEINARCSGTTGARALCGFNEPKMIADYLLFNKKPKYNIKNLSILRYWKELVVENKTLADFKKNKQRSNEHFIKL